MTGTIDARLKALGITLPAAVAPVANYVPYVRTGDLLHMSGQVTLIDGSVRYAGRLGDTVDVETGAAAARLCALNLIAQLRAALDGDLDRVERVVKLNVFVSSAPGFTQQPRVANGASDLMVELFGDAGRHARSAVGVASLPLDVSVEVDGIFEVSR